MLASLVGEEVWGLWIYWRQIQKKGPNLGMAWGSRLVNVAFVPTQLLSCGLIPKWEVGGVSTNFLTLPRMTRSNGSTYAGIVHTDV